MHFSRTVSNAAESALPRIEILYCRQNFIFCKIRPQYIGKIKLRICSLPQQKVGEPHFRPCSDDQVRRRTVGGIEMRGDILLRHMCFPFCYQAVYSIYNIGLELKKDEA